MRVAEEWGVASPAMSTSRRLPHSSYFPSQMYSPLPGESIDAILALGKERAPG